MRFTIGRKGRLNSGSVGRTLYCRGPLSFLGTARLRLSLLRFPSQRLHRKLNAIGRRKLYRRIIERCRPRA